MSSRISIISDVHSEFFSEKDWSNLYERFRYLEDEGVDILCACGDIGARFMGLCLLMKLLEYFPNLKILYVPGNHEYYGTNMDTFNDDLLRLSAICPRLYVFDNTARWSYVVNDITFIGGTLWTDFNKQNEATINIVKNGLNDYNQIYSGKGVLSTGRVLQEHYNTRKRIFNILGKTTGKCVVMTHHQPFLNDTYADLMSFGFCVDLEDNLNECDHLPDYWFSGHTHRSILKEKRYKNGNVVFVSNQVGYTFEKTTGYSPYCIVTL